MKKLIITTAILGLLVSCGVRDHIMEEHNAVLAKEEQAKQDIKDAEEAKRTAYIQKVAELKKEAKEKEYREILKKIATNKASCKSITSYIRRDFFTDKDKKLAVQSLRRIGYNSRDVHFIIYNRGYFGTGMSGLGMQCLGARIVNEAYYSGSGHSWQMKYGGTYVYLKGNGKATNMIVHSWN